MLNKSGRKSEPSRELSREPGEAKIPKRLEGCLTLGEAIRRIYDGKRELTRGILPSEVHEKIWGHILRQCEPWPDWVLRVAAEVSHVRFPTIPKTTIEDILRWFHFLMLEVRIDGTNRDAMPRFPDATHRVLGAVVGHLAAHIIRQGSLIEEARNTIPPDRFAELSESTSIDAFQRELAPAISDYLKLCPLGLLDFHEGFSEARSKTFDHRGSPRETPLSRVYERILSDWPEIERLSGPKALSEYLSPMLFNQHSDEKYERVKKICQRMRITFKGSVKGH